jgi:hypothetical protein
MMDKKLGGHTTNAVDLRDLETSNVPLCRSGF